MYAKIVNVAHIKQMTCMARAHEFSINFGIETEQTNANAGLFAMLNIGFNNLCMLRPNIELY